MRKLLPVIIILTSLNSSAGMISSFTKKISKLTSSFSSSSKTNLDYSIETYLKKDWEKSDLDKIVIKALADGADNSTLVTMSDKLIELQMRSLDLGDTLEFAMKRHGQGDRMLLEDMRSFNRLLAHIHTSLRKSNLDISIYKNDLRQVMKSLDDSFTGIRVNNISPEDKAVFNTFNKVRELVYSDLGL